MYITELKSVQEYNNNQYTQYSITELKSVININK